MELDALNVRLVLQTPEEALAQIEALSPEDKAQVSPDFLQKLRDATPGDPWSLGFSVRLRKTGQAIGSCGYKGPPKDGVVEIAYGIDPEHRGKGYATEAAAALVAFAMASGQVRVVCAHTLREANASTRVLTRCGFRHVGEVIDPEDGLVWRWEKTLGTPV